MPTTAPLPASLNDIPFAAWTVDDALVIDEVIGGRGLPDSFGLNPGTALDRRHPMIAGMLREAIAGAPSCRRVLLDGHAVLLDARPREAGGGAAVLAMLLPATPDAEGELTARQLEVLHLLCLGLTSRQIAQRLWIAETTVENHLRAVYRRLGCRTRAEAVSRAFRLGLVDAAVLDAVDVA